jgi:hypothetical protein
MSLRILKEYILSGMCALHAVQPYTDMFIHIHHSSFSLSSQIIFDKQCVRTKGMDLSQAGNFTGLTRDPAIGDKGGLIALLSGGRVTRPQYTAQVCQPCLPTSLLMINLHNHESFVLLWSQAFSSFLTFSLQ